MSKAYSTGPVRVRIGSVPPQSALPPGGGASEQARVGPILAALDAGEFARAVELSGQALASGVRHPTPLRVIAMAHESAGRFAAAIPYLRRALELAPGDVSLRTALARCLNGAGHSAEALAVVEQALAQAPSHAEAHACKGHALELLGLVAEAESHYGRALALEPANVLARTGMATLCSHYGKHREARGHAEAVLEAVPDHPPALLALAAADIAEGAPAAAEARLRDLIAARGPVPLFSSLLGDALDAQGHTPEAFEAYGRSGEALRRPHEPQYADDRILLAAERAAGVLAGLPADHWPQDRADPPEPAGVDAHVFLLGFARSGTTLLGLALEGHAQVEVLHEQEPLADALQHFAGPDGLERLLAATEAELAPLRSTYWRRALQAGARLDRPVFVDKHPFNSLHLPLIARLFPGARVLFARRDPRDVVLSCFRRRFLMNRYTYRLLTAEGAARLYDLAMKVADETARIAPLQTLAVAHEDLVQDFEPEMRRVCGFLGLDWSDALKGFAHRSHGVATPSASQLAKGLNSDGVAQWRRYARQLEPLGPFLDPWIERFGYAQLAAARLGAA